MVNGVNGEKVFMSRSRLDAIIIKKSCLRCGVPIDYLSNQTHPCCMYLLYFILVVIHQIGYFIDGVMDLFHKIVRIHTDNY